jgi:proton-dependent oligopeptide transporter, POT family
MLGILPLYLEDTQKGGIGESDEWAAVVIGTYIALVYFTPFIGGLIADRLLGCRKTIIIGGLLMMIGYFMIAIPGKAALYAGLGVVILGNGAFKPNISTILGNLYPPGSKLKDAGYNIFYMGINIGAFVCNFVAALVRNYYDTHESYLFGQRILGWSAAFATAGIGMAIGVVVFLFNYRKLASADPDPRASSKPQESLQPLFVHCLGPAIAIAAAAYFGVAYAEENYDFKAVSPVNAAFFAACIPVIYFYVKIWNEVEDQADRGRVAALLTIFGVVIIFWAIFHLNTTALTVWTRDNTVRGPAPQFLTDLGEGFAENATPKYYFNADKDVRRPQRSDFIIVSKEEFEKLEKDKKLGIEENKPIYVTQEVYDKVFQKTTEDTPSLDKGKHLKLINTELFASINPFFVVLFTPLVVSFFRWLRLRGQEPTTSAKLALGLLLTGCGPIVMLFATIITNDGQAGKGSPAWLFGVYAVATFGELFLSPMGLSLVNKMSPANIRAFMMGGWFLSTSFGNKLSGFFGELYQKMDHYIFWPMLAGSAAFFAAVIFLLLPWLNRQMTERKY